MHTSPNRLPRRQTSHDEWLETSVKLQQVLLEWPRLLRKHDRDAVADGISELGGARDQFLLLGIIFERRLGERAHEDLEKLRIDELRRALRRGRHDVSPFRSSRQARGSLAARDASIGGEYPRRRRPWRVRFR